MTKEYKFYINEGYIPNVMTDWEQKCFKDGKQIYYLDAYFKN